MTHYAAVMEAETGETFAERLNRQLENTGVEIMHAEVKGVELQGEIKLIYTDCGLARGKKVILANGTSPRCLGIPGETELTGKGMAMNAARDKDAYQGRHVYVVGGADGAVKEALYLAKYASKVTIVHFEEKIRLYCGISGESQPDAEHRTSAEIETPCSLRSGSSGITGAFG